MLNPDTNARKEKNIFSKNMGKKKRKKKKKRRKKRSKKRKKRTQRGVPPEMGPKIVFF